MTTPSGAWIVRGLCLGTIIEPDASSDIMVGPIFADTFVCVWCNDTSSHLQLTRSE